jgi:hypothetical protein
VEGVIAGSLGQHVDALIIETMVVLGVTINLCQSYRFRAITWEAWFDNFDRYRLTFVYDENIADCADVSRQARGGEHGHPDQDWFDAEPAREHRRRAYGWMRLSGSLPCRSRRSPLECVADLHDHVAGLAAPPTNGGLTLAQASVNATLSLQMVVAYQGPTSTFALRIFWFRM